MSKYLNDIPPHHRLKKNPPPRRSLTTEGWRMRMNRIIDKVDKGLTGDIDSMLEVRKLASKTSNDLEKLHV